MSQHDFNIANQSFPATRTDLNNALAALASNSSGDTEPGTTYANQWWYETDTNILKIRNEANNGWVDVITLDASMTATASELNQLDAITRGSIIYGNASGATARLAAGAASTVLTSDGTDIAWVTASSGGTPAVVFPNLASPNNTYTASGTWSKGGLADDDYVWFYLVGGGRGGVSASYPSTSGGGKGGSALLVYGTAGHFDGATYVIGAGGAGGNSGASGSNGGNTTITTTSANGSIAYVPYTGSWNDSLATDIPNKIMVSATSNAVIQSTTLVSGRAKTPYDFIFAANSEPTGWAGAVTGTWEDYAWTLAPGNTGSGFNGIFGGGGGGGKIQYGGNPLVQTPGGSLYAGAGGAHSGGAGAVPGGGGGGNSTNGQAGDGGAGNLRVYHV